MTVKTRAYVTKQLAGDTLTPISLYSALEGKHKMLFESSAKHEESGRYSFIALNPVAELVGTGNQCTFTKGEVTEQVDENAITYLRTVMPTVDEALPFSFFGGVIGHFGYDTAFYFEQIGDALPDPLDMPDVHAYFYDTFIIFDHLQQHVTLASIDIFGESTHEQLTQNVAVMEQHIYAGKVFTEEEAATVHFEPTVRKARFIEMVETAKEHIRNGDIFQVVLSQRFTSAFSGNPFSLYRKLRTSNASPYMFYMDFDDYTILGTSPESLIKVKDGFVTTNPIAGTKPRGKTKAEDEALAKSLLADDKEIAEHRMLVDLGRNDIGKISEIGSVQVGKYMTIEYYKHVMHIVSEVTGKLRRDYTAIDALISALPAGTVSGAPKIRAMQIINEQEDVKRGVYAGAVGYISLSGDMDLALAIRTMVVKDGKAHVQAGAGIVYDSIPESEYEETLNKAKALLEVRA